MLFVRCFSWEILHTFASEEERITCSPNFTRVPSQDFHETWQRKECFLEEKQTNRRGAQENRWRHKATLERSYANVLMSHGTSTKLYETKCPKMYAPADHLGSPLFSWDFPHSCTCWPSDQGNITVSLPHNLKWKMNSTLTSKSCRNHNKLSLFF